jgi:flagellar basal body-associated protein FliL
MRRGLALHLYLINKMMSINKKGGILLWIILIVIVLAVVGAVAIYFLITGDNGPLSLGGSNNIPSPPPLPE